ncbi:MAG: YraN family protein [Actinomycetota bacterium]
MPPGDRRAALGRGGEEAVARWYVAAGYQVLERNWRCREGELDLVVARGSTVVFCEVKTRSGDAFGIPAEAVTVSKQRRLRHLAVRWLAGRPGPGHRELRFDVASVRPGRDGRATVEVVEAAF